MRGSCVRTIRHENLTNDAPSEDQATAAADPDSGGRADRRLRALPGQANRRRSRRRLRDGVQGRPRHARRGDSRAWPRRARWREEPLAALGNDRLGGVVRGRPAGPLAVRGRGVDRSPRDLAGRAAPQGRRRAGGPRGRASEGARAPRARVADGRGGARRGRRRARRRGRLDAARGGRRPRARAVRRVVRALPALVGRVQGRREACCRSSQSSASTSSTCRRSIRSATTNRKGRNNALVAGAGRPRLAVGDRLGGGWPRRDPSRSSARGPTSTRWSCRREGGRRDRARLRDPVLAGPPVADGASRVVQPPPGRDAQVRREPAEALPGHLQRQLRVGGLARALAGAPRRRRSAGSSAASRFSVWTTRTRSRPRSGNG